MNTKRKLSKPALNLLKTTAWDGNVRDLRNVLKAISLQYADKMVTDEIIKAALQNHFYADESDIHLRQLTDKTRLAARNLLRSGGDDKESIYNEALSWIEKPLIEEALRMTKGNNVKAAELLGIHRNTLRTKIKALNIN